MSVALVVSGNEHPKTFTLVLGGNDRYSFADKLSGAWGTDDEFVQSVYSARMAGFDPVKVDVPNDTLGEFADYLEGEDYDAEAALIREQEEDALEQAEERMADEDEQTTETS